MLYVLLKLSLEDPNNVSSNPVKAPPLRRCFIIENAKTSTTFLQKLLTAGIIIINLQWDMILGPHLFGIL